MQSAKRVTVNTAILYGRMFITMFISLYSTRLVLNSLGSVDYGIYNLTAGLIAMLSFLTAAMSTSTQRYISFHQNENETPILKKIFVNSLLLHLFIGLLVVVSLQVLGVILFDKVLQISTERLHVAKEIFRFMSVTFLFTFISIPFSGTLSAHENMLWIACVNIIDVLMKFCLAVSLSHASGDKLQYYAIVSTIISGVTAFLYIVFCLNKYQECTFKFRKYFDFTIIKKLASFTGWNLFGSLSAVGKTQGIAILLNVFFGPIINAAYAIANQVSAQLNFFSTTMLSALNPQIMKSEGAGERSRMLRLAMIGSKFSFLLLAFIAIPCIFEMNAILTFWLKKVPEFTVSFCSLILVAVMLNQLTVGLDSAIQATGNIRKYMLVVGSVKLMILPFSYLLLKLEFSTSIVLIGYAAIEGIAGIFRLFILKDAVNLNIREYLMKVVYPIIPTVVITSIANFAIISSLDTEFRFMFTIPVSILVFSLTAYFTTLSIDERDTLNRICISFLSKGRAKYLSITQ